MMSRARPAAARGARRLRLLLRLYPSPFRDRFGDEMVATWTEQWRRPRTGLARLPFVLHFVHDVLASALAERLDRGRLAGPDEPRRRIAPAVVDDARFAVRAIMRRPAFAAAVVGTIALGIGPNAAVFSLVDAILLRPVPVADADRVIAVRATNGRWNGRMAWLDLHDLEDRVRSLDGLAGWAPFPVALEDGAAAEQLSAGLVSGTYFQVLGLRAAVREGG